MECEICIEKYNKSSRSPVTCPYCHYNACRKCCETWLLSETNARCINAQCGKEWTRQYVASTFTKTFMCNDYKKHRETVLFDQERALLPATQPLVENILQRERLDKEIRRIEAEELSAIYKRISALRAEHNRLGRSASDASKERSTFIKACPDTNCRGFLSSQWKCGLCEKWTCSDCHEVKGLTRDCEHVCDPNNVATAALLANDTKSCPSCGNGIHKLEGCDQMFCTMCNTGFSWRTGRIETNIHNPHYFEYLRRTGGDLQRNPNEIRCGQEINTPFVRALMASLRIKNFPQDIINRVSRICEAVIHHRYVEMERYQVDRVLNNQDLRIQYMRNHLTEDEFKTQIQRLDKKHQKNREIHNIFTIMNSTVTDILYRFDHAIKVAPNFSSSSDEENQKVCDILKEIDRIRDYVNECLVEISKTYGSRQLQFTDTMRLR